jgi:transposase
MVLSYSRKAYSEAVSRQDTETFLRCLENGLRSFSGSPLLLNLDNMKSAVLQADWFDPEINPKLADFCRHYKLHVVPCRPGTPEQHLKKLRLSGLLSSLEVRLHEAEANRLPYAEFLELRRELFLNPYALSVLRSNEKGGVYVTDSFAPVDEAARFPR